MERVKKGHLVINGIGSSNGGSFEDVLVNGVGTINGNIECEHMESSGKGHFKGNIVSESIKVNGTASFGGAISGEKIDIEGSVKIKKNVQVHLLKVSGNSTFGESVRGESINIEGRISITENCDAEQFHARGPIKIGGELNGESILIEPYGNCSIGEIGGQSISVKQSARLSHWLKPFFTNTLSVNSIEGDEIELESTIAKMVRGKNIKIGKKCEIDLVEYSDTFEVDNDADVKEYRKV
ncbi:hypothetical protein NG54_01725 [Heyndrickxia ginsengihumi]|uniref:Polymer-forming cytoskeletal protein n=1 Tax=Heyndrickxia ginsengihumi TaxID=363870 RepID=A0A0A6VJM4_9BACI|nr:hypothetical protein [Heyndrickxia ginsengihumi]KHD86799.1 hypothetical protein NG54_01725 [Heyndrickxia ginsengihumi]